MAPKYKLIYFNLVGRAEVSRLLFAQAGVEFEDKRVQTSDWMALKSTFPLGQLPVLHIDDFELPQSWAIARYLATEFGMYGSSNLEAAKINALVDTVSDMMEVVANIKWAQTDEAKTKASKSLEDKTPPMIKFVDSVLAQNESSGWLVGNKVSLADLALFNVVFVYCNNNLTAVDNFHAALKSHPRIGKHHEKVANLPRIKAWVASRPAPEPGF